VSPLLRLWQPAFSRALDTKGKDATRQEQRHGLA
jgi:hypothetical protein